VCRGLRVSYLMLSTIALDAQDVRANTERRLRLALGELEQRLGAGHDSRRVARRSPTSIEGEGSRSGRREPDRASRTVRVEPEDGHAVGAVQGAEVQDTLRFQPWQRQLDSASQALHAPPRTTWTSWFESASMAIPLFRTRTRRTGASSASARTGSTTCRRTTLSFVTSSILCQTARVLTADAPASVVELRVPAVHLHVDERRTRARRAELTTASGHIERGTAALARDDAIRRATQHVGPLGHARSRRTILSTSFEGPLKQLANRLREHEMPRDPFGCPVRVVAVSSIHGSSPRKASCSRSSSPSSSQPPSST
jgi:hypothetical protein